MYLLESKIGVSDSQNWESKFVVQRSTSLGDDIFSNEIWLDSAFICLFVYWLAFPENRLRVQNGKINWRDKNN